MTDPQLKIGVGVEWDLGNLDQVVAQAKQKIGSMAKRSNAGASEGNEIRRSAVAAQRSIDEARKSGGITSGEAIRASKDLNRAINNLLTTATGEVKKALSEVSKAGQRRKALPDVGPAYTPGMKKQAATAKRVVDAQAKAEAAAQKKADAETARQERIDRAARDRKAKDVERAKVNADKYAAAQEEKARRVKEATEKEAAKDAGRQQKAAEAAAAKALKDEEKARKDKERTEKRQAAADRRAQAPGIKAANAKRAAEEKREAEVTPATEFELAHRLKKRRVRQEDQAVLDIGDEGTPGRRPKLIARGRVSKRLIRGDEKIAERDVTTKADQERLGAAGAASADLKSELAGITRANAQYRAAMLDNAKSLRDLKTSLDGTLKADRDYARQTQELTDARRELAARGLLESQGVDTTDLSSEQILARGDAARQTRRAKESADALGALSEDDIAVQARRKVAGAETKGRVASKILGDPDEIARLANAGLLDKRLKNLVRIYQATGENASNLNDAQVELRIAELARADSERRAAFMNTKEGKLTTEANVRRRVSEAQANADVRRQEKSVMTDLIKRGELGGTRFQRLQAILSPGAGRTPADFQTVKQFAGTKALQTAGYGLSGAVFGGAAAGIGQAVKDAADLERSFVRMRGTLETLGQANRFDNVRAGIKEISNTTGIAATEIANLYERLLGLNRIPPPGQAVATFDPVGQTQEDAKAAAELMAVTGVDAQAAEQSIVPIAKSFGVHVREIGNVVVEAGEKYGIAEDQLLDFLGKSATVTKAAGGNMRELTVIGSNVALQLGKDMGSSADVFNKLPELLQHNQDEIFTILSEKPGTIGSVDAIAEQLHAGKQIPALIELFRALNVAQGEGGLDESQQKRLAKFIANPREIEEGIAVIRSAKQTLIDLNDPTVLAAENNRKLQERFKDFGETTQAAVEKVSRAWENFMETLFQSGLGSIFSSAAKGAEGLIKVIEVLVGAIGSLNEVTKNVPGFQGGMLSSFLQIGVAVGGLTKLIQFINGMWQRHTLAVAEDTTAENFNTASKVGNARASTAEGEAAAAAAAARGGAAAAPAAVDAVAKAGLLSRLKLGGQRALSGSTFSAFGKTPFASAGADAAVAGAGAEAGLAGYGLALPAAIAIIGATAVSARVNDQSRETGAAADALREAFRKKSVEQLRKIVVDHDSAWEQLGNLITGQDSAAEMKLQVLNEKVDQAPTAGTRVSKLLGEKGEGGKTYADTFATFASNEQLTSIQDQIRNSPELRKIAEDSGFEHTDNPTFAKIGVNDRVRSDFKVDRGKLEGFLAKAKAAGDDVGNKNRDEEKKLFELIGQMALDGKNLSVIREALAAAEAAGNREAEAALGTISSRIQLKLDTLRAQEAAGTITSGQFTSNLEGELAHQRTFLIGKDESSDEYQQALITIATIEKELRDRVDKRIQGLLAVSNKLADLGGRNKVDSLRAQLSGLQGQSEAAQLEQIPALIDASVAAYEAELDQIADPAARASRQRTGVQFDPRLKALMIRKQIVDSPGVANAVTSLAGFFQTETSAIEEAIAKKHEETGQAVSDVIADMLAQQQGLMEFAAGTDKNGYFGQLAAELRTNKIRTFIGTAPDQAAGLAHLAGYFNKSSDETIDWITNLAKESDRTVRDVAIEQIQKLLDSARLTLGAGADSNPHFQDLQRELEYWKNLDPNAGAPAGAKVDTGASRQAEGARLKAGISLETSRKGLADMAKEDDAVRKAEIDHNIALQNYEDKKDTGTKQMLDESEAALNEARTSQDSAQKNLEEIGRGWAHVLANGDPIAETLASIRDAQADALRARSEGRGGDAEKADIEAAKLQNSLVDQNNEVLRSRGSINAAEHERDPIASAQIALGLAKNAEATAKGDAAKNEAAAARIRAEHGLEDAFSALVTSRTDLLIAMANAAEHTVEAAKLAAGETQRKLNEAIARGASEGELNPLRTANVAAQANFVRSQFQEERDAIDFAADMGQITIQQQIEAYKAMLGTTEVGTARYRDLMRTIRQLQQTSEQDTQFNLPTNIALPTLYEARRLNQSSMMGIGYQDNRSVVMTVAINGAQSAEAIVSQLASVFDAGTSRAPMYSN